MQPEPDHSNNLAHWRDDLLRAVLRYAVPLSTVLTLLGTALAIAQSSVAMAVSNLLGWAALITLNQAKQWPTRLRAGGVVLITIGVGISFLANDIGAFGLLWLFAAPLMAAVLLGRREALGLIVATTLSVFSWGWAVGLPLDPLPLANLPAVKWAMLGLNFGLLTTLISVATAVLLRKLDTALQEAHQAQTAHQELAETDTLTGLPNRRKLHAELRQTLQRSHRSGEAAAVLFIDVDHFKDINDTYGHLEGDQVLVQLALQLAKQVPAPSVLARSGGDEFVLLYRPPTQPGRPLQEQVLELASRIRHTLQQPLQLPSGISHHATLSVGVSLLDRPQMTVDDVMREADTAMYQAKSQGRNRLLFFTPAMHDALRDRVVLERDLRDALNKNEGLSLAIQAQTDATGKLVGAEVLARWQHPTRGPVSPVQFIPIAERSGLVVPLGQWVLEQACLLALELQRRALHCPISVNISVRQFRAPGFERQLLDTLAWHAVTPEAVVLEVTESLLATDQADTIALMQRLHRHGVRFSMDDFGTGYSSLSYLKALPLHELKIDRSFVDDLPGDANDAALVKTILSMARELGLNVVAEGVETDDQVQFLHQHGCQCFQGYRFSRPLPQAEWLALWASPQG